MVGSSHARDKGLAQEAGGGVVLKGLEEWRLIVCWRVVAVGQLHEQESLRAHKISIEGSNFNPTIH